MTSYGMGEGGLVDCSTLYDRGRDFSCCRRRHQNSLKLCKVALNFCHDIL